MAEKSNWGKARFLVHPVLCWINWLSLCGLGGFSTYLFSSDFSAALNVVLLIYITIIGAAGVMVEAGVPQCRKQLHMLTTLLGKAIVFTFVGTIGVSFWIRHPPQMCIPFIMGIFSIVVGALCIAAWAMCGKEDTVKPPLFNEERNRAYAAGPAML